MNITISVLAGIQCLWQVGFHFKHKPKKKWSSQAYYKQSS